MVEPPRDSRQRRREAGKLPRGVADADSICDLFGEAQAQVARLNVPDQDAQDLVQELMLGFLTGRIRLAETTRTRSLGPWTLGVLRNLRRTAQVRRRPHGPAGTSFEALDGSGQEDPHPQLPSARVQLLRAAGELPSPHALLMVLALRGHTIAEMHAWLSNWDPVSRDRTRKLLRESRQMMRVGLTGGDPRAHWPWRYRKKSRFSRPPSIPNTLRSGRPPIMRKY